MNISNAPQGDVLFHQSRCKQIEKFRRTRGALVYGIERGNYLVKRHARRAGAQTLLASTVFMFVQRAEVRVHCQQRLCVRDFTVKSAL